MKGKYTLAKIGLRGALAKVTGKQWATAVRRCRAGCCSHAEVRRRYSNRLRSAL